MIRCSYCPRYQGQIPPPSKYLIIRFAIKALGSKNIVDRLAHAPHWIVRPWVLYSSAYVDYGSILQKRTELLFKTITIVKYEFAWTWVPAYLYMIEQSAHPCRLFVYVFNIPICYLLKVKARDFTNSEPYCVWINKFYAIKAKILLDDITNRILLSYITVICYYQVHMH